MNKDILIRHVRQLLPMGYDSASQLLINFIPNKIARNAYLLKAGAVCNESHFIESGIIRSYTFDFEGNEVTTAFYSKNMFTSDLLSFFKRTASKEYIQAITDCEIWSTSYEDMQDSFHAFPEYREFGRLNIINQYGMLKQRMLSVLQETAEQRYHELVSSDPEIIQQVPLKYIASYLGVTDTSLSRIRKEYSKK